MKSDPTHINFYDYYTKVLSANGVILKLQDLDLFIIPETDCGKIGFNGFLEVETGSGMKGRLEIKASFVIPKGFNFKLSADCNKFHKLIENMEFIKSIKRAHLTERFDNIKYKKKQKEKEKND